MYFGHFENGYFDNACFPSKTLTGVSAGNAWGTYYCEPFAHYFDKRLTFKPFRQSGAMPISLVTSDDIDL
jgi:hypothetical protein